MLGTALGSDRGLSPEQFSSEEELDAFTGCADIWHPRLLPGFNQTENVMKDIANPRRDESNTGKELHPLQSREIKVFYAR